MGHPPLAVAYGMGVDSTAMLIGLHDRDIRPDAILFADTGGEKPATYAYLSVINGWLASVGFPTVTVVRRAPTEGKHGAYDTLEGNCITNRTLPSLAFGRKACSMKWKADPQHQWCRSWAPAVEAWTNGERVVKAIGYDAGPKDSRRADIPEDRWYTYRYPLREWGWTREVCVERIEAEGMPVPVKSACYFCPSMKPDEVRTLCVESPDLARRIIAMEAGAEDGLTAIDGLWRKPVQGFRGATPRPGTMTEMIVGEELLPEYVGQALVVPWWLRGERPSNDRFKPSTAPPGPNDRS